MTSHHSPRRAPRRGPALRPAARALGRPRPASLRIRAAPARPALRRGTGRRGATGGVTPRQACPRPDGLGRNLRSKIRWFAGFCNSHHVSHFATFFIDARAEISVAGSRFDSRVFGGRAPASSPGGRRPRARPRSFSLARAAPGGRLSGPPDRRGVRPAARGPRRRARGRARGARRALGAAAATGARNRAGATLGRPFSRASAGRGRGFDDNDPSAGSPTETLLRLLLPLNDKVQRTSRDVAGGGPPSSPRSERFTGPFNR